MYTKLIKLPQRNLKFQLEAESFKLLKILSREISWLHQPWDMDDRMKALNAS